MTYSVLIAAPLLIAAVVTALRFVGCTQDFDQFEPDGDEGGEGTDVEKRQAVATLSDSGTLSAVAAFAAHKPDVERTPFTQAGPQTYPIPWWCNFVDLFLLGAGGGASSNNGGLGGSWQTVTLWRGPGEPPTGAIEIPATTPAITMTVGAGGAAGSATTQPTDGGDTTATAVGMPDQKAAGGVAAANSSVIGTGPQPPTQTLGPTTEEAGADRTDPGQPGNPPGGGGAGGGFFAGGPGADGAVWIVARQT